jgi:hypothetical protein
VKEAWQPDCRQDEAQQLVVPTVYHVALSCIGDRGKRQICCALAVGSKGYLYICVFEGFRGRSPKAPIDSFSREKSGALQMQIVYRLVGGSSADRRVLSKRHFIILPLYGLCTVRQPESRGVIFQAIDECSGLDRHSAGVMQESRDCCRVEPYVHIHPRANPSPFGELT